MLNFGDVPQAEFQPMPKLDLAPDYMKHTVLSVLDRAGMLKQGMQSVQEETRDLPAAQLANVDQAAFPAQTQLPTLSQTADPQAPGMRRSVYGTGNEGRNAEVMGLKAQGVAHLAAAQPAQATADMLRSKQFLADNLLNDPGLVEVLGRNTIPLANVGRRMG